MNVDTLRKLESEKQSLQEQISELDKKIDQELSTTLVRCTACGLGYEIKDLTFIQTHWYNRDYWASGEGQWKCSCDKVNRLYGRPDLMRLKHLFKNVVDTYDE